MSKRRQVREAVVQFIYAAGSGDILPSADEAPALDLLLEPHLLMLQPHSIEVLLAAVEGI